MLPDLPNILTVQTHERLGGKQTIVRFRNGYGASVVDHAMSYGVELAVLKFADGESPDFDLCYDTPITDDVLGYLTPETLREALEAIAEL